MKTLSLLLLSLFAINLWAQPENSALMIKDAKHAARIRIDLIRSAQDEILISTHTLAEDALGNRLLGELIAAKEKNPKLKIKLVVDAWEKKKNFTPAMRQALEGLGVEVYQFRPLSPGYLWNVNRRMHDKLFIVDRKFLVQGDRNLTKDYYSMGHEAFVSKEFYYEGKVPKEAAQYFDDLLKEEAVSRTVLKGVSTPEVAEKTQVLKKYANKRLNNIFAGTDNWKRTLETIEEVNFFHDNVKLKGKVPGTEAPLLDMIKNAKKRVIIENPYIVLTDEFRAAIRQARKNGAEITVVTNSPHATDQKLVGAAWEESREFLKSIGATIWEHPGAHPKTNYSKWKIRSMYQNFMEKAIHTKMLIVDDMLAIKSFNLDPRSQKHNMEIVVQMKSRSMADEAAKTVKNDIMNRGYINSVYRGHTNKIVPGLNCRTKKVLSYLLRYYL